MPWINACPCCGGRTEMRQSSSYFMEWEQCRNEECQWRSNAKPIPLERR